MALLPLLVMLICRPANALDAPRLIAALAHTPPATTRFVEVGFVSMLDQPLLPEPLQVTAGCLGGQPEFSGQSPVGGNVFLPAARRDQFQNGAFRHHVSFPSICFTRGK